MTLPTPFDENPARSRILTAIPYSTANMNVDITSQENLRGKLEQLSTMYEEVSARMENLEKAYAQAENEVRTKKKRRHGDGGGLIS